MIERWILLAGEEAGPPSNKLGGIWNVIDAEAQTLASMASEGSIDSRLKILVLGPYYPSSGSDWHTSKNRITDLSYKIKLNMGQDLDIILSDLRSSGMDIVTGQRMIDEVPVGYILFNTNLFQHQMIRYKDQNITLNNAVKTEAYGLVGLDSIQFERTNYGSEYNHYLNLSYAISELARRMTLQQEETASKYEDKAISEFAKAIMPKLRVSLHCHEFGVFYSIARLKKLGIPIRTMATMHATVPGRTAGHKTLQKIAHNDSDIEPGTPTGFAFLESLAKYADAVTFVGDSTMKEAMLFHRIKGIVIRNGIDVEVEDINWTKKENCRDRIQKFISENLYKFHDGQRIDPENIIPIFTISRIELENKGYPQLLSALVLQDHLLKHRVMGQRRAENFRVVCFLITAHGPKNKDKLPEGFPINLPKEVLIGDEIRLENMIEEYNLDERELITGKRLVAAMLYPQWVGLDDGGLGMNVDEIMAGCVAGVFPSQYEPFLLTALEAGKEGTPSIVSRAAGLSDALKKVKRRVAGLGGVIIVDNIESTYQEMAIDYALAMDYFAWTFIEDEVKYRLLCEESFSLATQFGWREPVLEYYKNLTV